MIVEEHVKGYIESLDEGLPERLAELERKALECEVPIIRKDAIGMLRFLLRTREPERILEVGTAVGFSALVMSEFAPGAEIVTLEKVAMRITEAEKNLADAERIAMFTGDANDVLRFLSGDGDKSPEEVYIKGVKYDFSSYVEKFGKKLPYSGAIIPGIEIFDFIFLDAAKGQYMSFLEPIMKLLKPGGMLVTDNVLSEGLLAQSKYAIVRRDRTIHMRMREYLYHITHCDELETVVLPLADGMSISVKKKKA